MGEILLVLGCLSASVESAPSAEARALEIVADEDDSLGITYEIYVRSFKDSDGDGIGDLRGVREQLDYLEALGVETLWLMPIFEADAVAGYGVTDYARVAPDYGSEADLRDLVQAAHGLGMRVLLDLPCNHVSRQHPWFAEADAGQNRERFVFANEQYDLVRWFPAADGSYFYGFFGDQLPDLNWRNEDLVAEMLDMARGWLDVGVDGFRLDAVSTLIEADGYVTNAPQTHELLAHMRQNLRDTHPGAILLAEAGDPAWTRNQAYLGSDAAPEATQVLDFPRRDALFAAIAEGNPTPLRAMLAVEAGKANADAAFVGSHDVPRLASAVADPAARRALMALLLTLPGQPVLYYGEELDLPDATTATGQDYAWRAPMPWNDSANAGFTSATDAWLPPDNSFLTGVNVAEESTDPTSMLRWVQSLAELRLASEALRTGSLRFLPAEPTVLSFERVAGSEVLRVDINLAAEASATEYGALGGYGCQARTGSTVWAEC